MLNIYTLGLKLFEGYWDQLTTFPTSTFGDARTSGISGIVLGIIPLRLRQCARIAPKKVCWATVLGYFVCAHIKALWRCAGDRSTEAASFCAQCPQGRVLGKHFVILRTWHIKAIWHSAGDRTTEAVSMCAHCPQGRVLGNHLVILCMPFYACLVVFS